MEERPKLIFAIYLVVLVLVVLGIIAIQGHFSSKRHIGGKAEEDDRFQIGTPEYTIFKDHKQQDAVLSIEAKEELKDLEHSKTFLLNNTPTDVLTVEGNLVFPVIQKVVFVHPMDDDDKWEELVDYFEPVSDMELIRNHGVQRSNPDVARHINIMTALFQANRDKMHTFICEQRPTQELLEVNEQLDTIEAMYGNRWDVIILDQSGTKSVQLLNEVDKDTKLNRLLSTDMHDFVVNWRYAGKLIRTLQQHLLDGLSSQEWNHAPYKAVQALQQEDLWIGYNHGLIDEDVQLFEWPKPTTRKIAICVVLPNDQYENLLTLEKTIYNCLFKLHEVELFVWSSHKLTKKTRDGLRRHVFPLGDLDTKDLLTTLKKACHMKRNRLAQFDNVFVMSPNVQIYSVVPDEDLLKPGVILSPVNTLGGHGILQGGDARSWLDYCSDQQENVKTHMLSYDYMVPHCCLGEQSPSECALFKPFVQTAKVIDA